MELFAVFETWHLGDGNYPAVKKGQLVNLSFEVQPDELRLAPRESRFELDHLGQGTYRFTGLVTRVYDRGDQANPIVVIETERFRFYMHSSRSETLALGKRRHRARNLLFDHYIWVEYLSSYPDPPDLFYSLRVTDIWRFRIPERFITRSERGNAYPTWVRPEEYGPDDVSKVDVVSDEDFVNYVIQFSDDDVLSQTVARTFLS
jgi:hypothetical protein